MENLKRLCDIYLSDFKLYRKFRGGYWRYVRISGHWVFYWTNREVIYNEELIKEETY